MCCRLGSAVPTLARLGHRHSAGRSQSGAVCSDVGQEYQLAAREKEGNMDSSYLKAPPNEMLLRLQRTTPYYQARPAPPILGWTEEPMAPQ